jgi:hypothetical protein
MKKIPYIEKKKQKLYYTNQILKFTKFLILFNSLFSCVLLHHK